MKFNKIDTETWKRKEYFSHYFNAVPCTYSMTVRLDITSILKAKSKLYPTMLYYITKTVNRYEEFRTSLNEKGELGIFDEMLPSYTVFCKDTETFCNLWTDYTPDIRQFISSYEKDVEKYSQSEQMNPKPDMPENVFNVSMIPWTTFEAFNLNIKSEYRYLLPIFTMGRYYEQDGKILLPLAVQVHHAVCDGYHVCRLVNQLQQDISNHKTIE